MLNRILITQPDVGNDRGRRAARRRHVHGPQNGSGRFPGPERADGRRDDRGERHGGRRSRADRDLPDRNGRERSDRRASRPFELDLRLLGRMGRVRLGNRHLPGPPDRIRKAGCAERDASERRRDADTRAAVVHPGRADDYRPDLGQHFARRTADTGRLDDPPPTALDRRCSPGDRHRRRYQGVPNPAGPCPDETFRRHDGRSARRGREPDP